MDDTLAQRFTDRCGAIVHPKLQINFGQRVLDGLLRQMQPLGDLPVTQALDQPLHDLDFAFTHDYRPADCLSSRQTPELIEHV